MLIIAETEPAEPDTQTGRLMESVSPGAKQGEGHSPVPDLRLSFCEDGWSNVGGIQPEK